MGFHSHGIDDAVRSPAVRHFLKRGGDVLDGASIHCFHTPGLGQLQALVHEIHADDAINAHLLGGPNGHLPHRPQTNDGQGVTRAHIGPFHALPGGGKDVTEVEETLVGV